MCMVSNLTNGKLFFPQPLDLAEQNTLQTALSLDKVQVAGYNGYSKTKHVIRSHCVLFQLVFI